MLLGEISNAMAWKPTHQVHIDQFPDPRDGYADCTRCYCQVLMKFMRIAGEGTRTPTPFGTGS